MRSGVLGVTDLPANAQPACQARTRHPRALKRTPHRASPPPIPGRHHARRKPLHHPTSPIPPAPLSRLQHLQPLQHPHTRLPPASPRLSGTPAPACRRHRRVPPALPHSSARPGSRASPALAPSGTPPLGRLWRCRCLSTARNPPGPPALRTSPAGVARSPARCATACGTMRPRSNCRCADRPCTKASVRAVLPAPAVPCLCA